MIYIDKLRAYLMAYLCPELWMVPLKTLWQTHGEFFSGNITRIELISFQTFINPFNCWNRNIWGEIHQSMPPDALVPHIAWPSVAIICRKWAHAPTRKSFNYLSTISVLPSERKCRCVFYSFSLKFTMSTIKFKYEILTFLPFFTATSIPCVWLVWRMWHRLERYADGH